MRSKRIRKYWGKKKDDYEDIEDDERGDFPWEQPEYLETVDNRIYFYSEIDRDKVLQLNKELRSLNNEILHESMIRERKAEDIFLHINSFGGEIFSGLACVDNILKSRVPVTTIIDGCCASSATLISIVGKKRLINKNAFMLIHQLSGGMWGKYQEFKDEMKNQDMIMDTIKRLYHQYTKIPHKKLEEILKHDLWFDAETCLKFDMVDKII